MGKDQELLEAARSGNAAVVEKILNQRAKRSGPLASLRRGPGANVQDASGYSALHHAALNGHHDIVELLLTHEASTNILDDKGSSPLHLAAWAGNVDIVRLLLCHGPSVPNVNLTTKDHETALHCAAQYGHTEIVTLLLEHSCDPTIRNTREETALDLAAQYGRLETVELLVRTHPELIQPYSRSYKSGSVFRHTPLHLASRNGHKLVVDILLSSGMDVNVKTSGGTALHEAALCGKLDVVRTLLDAGVDLRLKDAQQNTVMDLLRQFPKHVTQDIFNTIKRRPTVQKSEDSDSESGHASQVPVAHNLGSPYENVKILPEQGRRLRYSGRSNTTNSGMESSPGSSPVQNWDSYPHKRNNVTHLDFSKSGMIDSSTLSEDIYQRDADQISISSAASSASGPSSRDRRLVASSDYTGSYVPMGPGSMPSPGSTGSKVSPTPPKKPPRRNLSVSPTHLSPNVSLPSPTAYEYLYLARSGDETTPSRKPEMLRRGKSADQYEVMKLRQNYVTPIDINELKNSPILQRRKSEDSGRFLQEKREPVALTLFYDNIQVRTTNPRRKLRRNPNDRDKVYENYEPPYLVESNEASDGKNECNNTFVSNAYITLKSSQESLLDDVGKKSKKTVETRNGVTKTIFPLSPTHYQQPPTPDHPPPSALQAEISIHERIRPLSQEYKRRSRDIETETDEELLLYQVSLDSSGSFSSSVSLSDKSVSTDNNVEEYVGDAPFAVIGPPCDATRGCLSNNKFKSSALVAVRSESKREENLKLRNPEDKIMMTKDEGYYSFEHNRHDCLRSKSDAATQTCLPRGLFKGSTSQLMDAGHRTVPPERPKTLRKLKNVYENAGKGGDESGATVTEDGNRSSATISGPEKSLSILSPFDEQEEWAKISEIMASFSSGLIRDSIFVAEMEKEIQSRLGLGIQSKPEEKIVSEIGQWLQTMSLERYEPVLLENGYDDLDFLNGLLDENEAKILGFSEEDAATLLSQIANLPDKITQVQKLFPPNNNNNMNKIRHDDDYNSNGSSNNNNNNNHLCEDGSEGADPEPESDFEIVDKWLDSIRLGVYKETFKLHSYLDFERIKRLWEIELSSVLDITKRGHRKRILASVNASFSGVSSSGPNLEEITADLSQLKSNIQLLKDEIREKLPVPQPATGAPAVSPNAAPPNLIVPPAGTLRHSHKKNKPAPPPPTGMDAGTPAKSGPGPNLPIRNPSELLVGVPSTLTTKWRHRPEELVTGCITYVANYLGSTVVKELKGTESTKKSIQKLKKTSKELTTTPDIMLAISYRGVKFLNTGTQELVCEHEIRNIHCACQDADDLTHFAYITKDHISRSHYCHVFCVETMDQATEVILTLGQAFEVAYQITLREQIAGSRRGNGHTRSQSANQIVSNLVSMNNSTPQQSSNHSRSLSVNEMKINDDREECEKAPLVVNEDL